jgi:hypothetical protein
LNLDIAKFNVTSAYDMASSSVRLISDDIRLRISNSPITGHVQNDSFVSSAESFRETLRNIASSAINTILIGFGQRVDNTRIDYSNSSPSDVDYSDFESHITTHVTKLTTLSNDIMTLIDDMVSDHISKRSLLRPAAYTISDFVVGSPVVVTCEFKNVGSVTWTGWMSVTAIDEYKKKIKSSSPKSISVIEPGASSVLTQSIVVPRTVVVNGNDRTWGKKTTVSISIVTSSSVAKSNKELF